MAEEQDHNKEQPIVIKKIKKGGHGGHHGGSWKVAYADFVTAMMAFFIVMWILASSPQAALEKMAEYFNNPEEFSVFDGKPKGEVLVDIGLKKRPGQGTEKYKQIREEEFANILFDKQQKDSVYVSQEKREECIEDSLKAARRVLEMGNEIKGDLNKLVIRKPELQELLESIEIQVTKEGLRIELIEKSDALFFEVGSAKLSKDAIDIISQLGREIGKLPNEVEIEGHTDSRSYGEGASYSNWELSADRANTARRVLERNGVPPGQIVKVTGFADQKLRNPANPFDLSNRRVSILIKQITSEDFLQNSIVEE